MKGVALQSDSQKFLGNSNGICFQTTERILKKIKTRYFSVGFKTSIFNKQRS